MDELNTFERQVARDALRDAGPSRPVDPAAVFARAVTTTQSPKWRFQSMFSATKFVVAGAIVALFGGFLLSGVLTQQPSDEPLPPAAASASSSPVADATATPQPTTSVDAEMTIRSDLLTGVDLAVEEVEPSVFRVLSDGFREPSRTRDDKDRYFGGILDGNVVAGLDGSLWWFGPDGFYRLGEEAMHRWPKEIWEDFAPGQADIEVAPDGTVWLTAFLGKPGKNARAVILSYDGQAWSERWQGSANKRPYGVEVQQDGTVWMAWSTKKGDGSSGVIRAARLGDNGWETLPGSVRTRDLGGGDVIVAESGGSDAWVMSGYYIHGPLYRHDGEGWVVEQTPEVGGVARAAVGPDGTLWVRLNAECVPEDRLCGSVSDILARFDGSDWDVHDSSDGIPMMGDHYQGFEGFFAVAPDRSVWFNPIGDYERTGSECDGLANFDGQAVRYFLRDRCIFAMDMATDGTVWLQAGDSARPGPIGTYVITPEAVAE
jgi:hypothetical protein